MAYVRGNDYFKMFLELIDFSCKSAVELDALLHDFNTKELSESLASLHKIEHAADECKHEMLEKLSKEFITPIDREDIVQLANLVDDITDAIEDVLIKLYMFNIKTIEPQALEFCKIIVDCCEALRTVFKDFHNFKKSKQLHNSIIKVNSLEEVGDNLFVEAVRNMHVKSKDPLQIFSWTEIYTVFEKCCDLCERTANTVEEVIMKNS